MSFIHLRDDIYYNKNNRYKKNFEMKTKKRIGIGINIFFPHFKNNKTGKCLNNPIFF